MSRARRSDSWGFPRWGGYGGARDTVQVRLCDRVGCTEPGTCPAPKSPNSPDRWMFCQAHAAEYNAGSLSGVIGVIGPTRMPYDKVIALVDHTSRLVSNLLC